MMSYNPPPLHKKGMEVICPHCRSMNVREGWELRLTTDGQSQPLTTVRSPNEMRTLVETWRTAMHENGWN